MKTRIVAFVGVITSCLLLGVNRAQAAPIGIDSTVTNPVLSIAAGTDAEILSFDVGAITYDQLTFLGPALTINNASQTFARIGNADPPDDLATAMALVGNKYLTQGKANASNVRFDFGQTLLPSDGTRFFMYELVLATDTVADDVVVKPTLGGTAIGDWSLTLDAADYGALSNIFRMTLLSGSDVYARGVTFALDDFTGTGTLGSVDGLLFTDPGSTWDPLSVGIAVSSVVPEPGSLALLLSGVVAAWAVRRRFRSA